MGGMVVVSLRHTFMASVFLVFSAHCFIDIGAGSAFTVGSSIWPGHWLHRRCLDGERHREWAEPSHQLHKIFDAN